MPELPEVEHAARSLRRWLGAARIVRAEADPTRVFRGGRRRAFAERLGGRKLIRVERRGKYLLLAFDEDVGLISHLGMTGSWVWRPGDSPRPTHSRARLHLEGGEIIHYQDPRLFGRIAICAASELERLPEVAALGPDPVRDGIDVARLGRVLATTRRAVKVALLDQRVLAGIGNILATEALFRARIHPERPAQSLAAREIRALAGAIEASIAHSMATMTDDELTYVTEDAEENPFLVYGRAGEPCPRCGRPLETQVIGGRSSAHCRRCQRPRGAASQPPVRRPAP